MRGSLLLLLVASCAGDAPVEGWRAKVGDEATCDPAEEGCWPEADRRALARAVQALEDAGPADRAGALCVAVRRLDALEHKLRAEDLALAADAEDAWCGDAPPDDAALTREAARLHADVLGRLEGDMVRAYMTPVAEAIQVLVDGPSCEGCAAARSVAPGVAIPERWPAGVQDAVAEIAATGLFGQTLAVMLVTGGALDVDYAADAETLFEPGMSVEARVQRIVDKAENASTWAGAVTGAESLVPIAGIAVSIAHEEWWMLAIHVKMMLRIAHAYGWDLTDGPTMIAALSIVMQDGLLPEGTDVVVPSVTMPILMRQAQARFGVWTAGRIGSFLTLKATRWIVTMLRRRATSSLTGAVVREGAEGVAKQLVGWLSAGASVAIGAVGDRVLTTILGRRAAHTGKRWLGALGEEGSILLAEPGARDCAFATWAAMARADGSVSPLELRLYEALVARPIWTSDTSSFVADLEEQASRADTLRSGEAPDLDCIDVGFADQPGRERRTFLADAFALAAIDGDEDASESELFADLQARLDDGWLAPLDVSLVEQIQRTIRAEVALPDSDVGREMELTIEDVVPALDVPAETRAAFGER